MKKHIKNNLIVIIIFFIIIGVFIYSFIDYSNNRKLLAQGRIETVEYCEDLLSNSSDNLEMVETCEEVVATKDEEKNFFVELADFLVFRLSFLNPTAFLILVIPSIYCVCKLIKNKYIVNAKTRMNYLDFMKLLLKSAYKYIWLLPLLISIVFVFLFFNTTFDSTTELLNGGAYWNMSTMSQPIIFFILYYINILLHSSIFINLGLIVARKQPKYILTIVFSFLIYIGIEIFLELVVNAIIIQGIFKSEIGYLFNIMNPFTFYDTFGIVSLMLFITGMFIISCVGVYFSYRNQEKFIIDCEKGI